MARDFSDSRKQLHWSAQLLSASADALVEKTDDDSHSNLEWDGPRNRLVNRAGLEIDVPGFSLVVDQQQYEMSGKSLADLFQWLNQKVGTELKLRDYDMPEHPVASGQPFSPDEGCLKQIANYFTVAKESLTGNGDIRIWPHHFDMGFWSPSEFEGKSIGGGFSLGDDKIDQPYFYVNPYGIDQPEKLPELSAGHWSEFWFGAVLTSSEFLQPQADLEFEMEQLAKQFVKSAKAAAQEILLLES